MFPPKSTNVSVTTRPATTGTGVRSILVLNKDVAAGEVIYKVRHHVLQFRNVFRQDIY